MEIPNQIKLLAADFEKEVLEEGSHKFSIEELEFMEQMSLLVVQQELGQAVTDFRDVKEILSKRLPNSIRRKALFLRLIADFYSTVKSHHDLPLEDALSFESASHNKKSDIYEKRVDELDKTNGKNLKMEEFSKALEEYNSERTAEDNEYYAKEYNRLFNLVFSLWLKFLKKNVEKLNIQESV